MKHLSLKILISFLFAGSLFASCSDDDPVVPTPMVEPSIVELALANDNLSSLVAALQQANLVTTLEGDGPFTVFAPKNAAFDDLFTKLGVGSLSEIDASTLESVLLYHVLGAEVKSTEISNGYVTTAATNADGDVILLQTNADSGVVLNSSSNVTSADMDASNGIVHVIDEVLLPPSVVDIALQNSNFSILVEALSRVNLVGTLSGDGPFTVFAPTNDAFANLLTTLNATSLDDIDDDTLTSVLLYHVVSGNVRSGDLTNGNVTTLQESDITVDITNGVKINNANVALADLQGTNGVVHVIDTVLMP